MSDAPYHNLLINGEEAISGVGRAGATDNGASARQGPFSIWHLNKTSDLYDFSFTTSEDFEASPSYNCVEQVAAVFSLNLNPVTPSSGLYYYTNFF